MSWTHQIYKRFDSVYIEASDSVKTCVLTMTHITHTAITTITVSSSKYYNYIVYLISVETHV